MQAKDPVVRDQATVAKIFKALQTGETLTPKELQLGSSELTRLYARKEALLI